MAAAFAALRDGRLVGGELASVRLRQRLIRLFFALIDFGRRSDLLADVPGVFAQLREHVLPDIDVTEDHLGRAIPESIIRYLDQHLDLLGCRSSDWLAVEPTALTAMYRTIYLVMRDTGRRSNEFLSLRRGCVEWIDDQPNLIYDNHKARRLRRRLPITRTLAGAITAWEVELDTSSFPGRDQWLFPSPRGSAVGHLSDGAWNTIVHKWVRAIPGPDDDTIGPTDGLACDRSRIFPHAFRHSYAQRHADAGVAVDVLRDLLDHRSSATTLGYYRVTLKRKRAAIRLVGQFSLDRYGNIAPITDVSSYEIGTVAVPFGNCTEPSNVKAGGHACPIRFQCAGCGFYRPDPSYLPAVEQHTHQLRADREIAIADDAATFVVDNLTAQIDAFTVVTDTMRRCLDTLDPDERAEVEQAAIILRRSRAAHRPSAQADHSPDPPGAVNARKP